MVALLGEAEQLEYWLAIVHDDAESHEMMCKGEWLQKVRVDEFGVYFQRCETRQSSVLWRDAMLQQVFCESVSEEEWLLSKQVSVTPVISVCVFVCDFYVISTMYVISV